MCLRLSLRPHQRHIWIPLLYALSSVRWYRANRWISVTLDSHCINRSHPRATSITWPHARMAIGVGSDIIISSLPNNWPTFARLRRNIRAPLIFEVGVLTTYIYPRPRNRSADTPTIFQVSTANSATIVAWVMSALADRNARS